MSAKPMSDEQMARARELCAKATAGPWWIEQCPKAQDDREPWLVKYRWDDVPTWLAESSEHKNSKINLELMAESRTLLPAALATIDELRKENAALRHDRITLDKIDAAAGDEDAVSLIEAAKKLPRTRDGVVVQDGMTLYRDYPINGIGDEITVRVVAQSKTLRGSVINVLASEYWFSTRAAAEAAKGEGV